MTGSQDPTLDPRSPGGDAAPLASTSSLPNALAPSRATVAAAALIVGAEANEIAAESEDDSRSATASASARAARPAPGPHSPRRRSARLVRTAIAPATASLATVSEQEAPRNTNSELRDWIKDNATLLSNASLLISIAALALGLLPETGVLDPYIKALIFGAALVLLIELHHQWPEDLQLHMLRKNALSQNHSWRMTAFAFLMQVATLIFAVWATLTSPLILIPLTALAVVLAFRQWYFRRHKGFVATSFGILALVAVLLLSELLMIVVWAVVTDEEITIELWTEERPGLHIEN